MEPLTAGPNVRRSGNCLLDLSGTAQVLLGSVIGAGASAEIRLGVDRWGGQHAWRVLRMGSQPGVREDGDVWFPSPWHALNSELAALYHARSPLLPARCFLDFEGRFYMAMRPYQLDIIDLSLGLRTNLDHSLDTGANAFRQFGEVAVVLAKAMLEPLCRLHAENTVHRDVKVDNVLWAPGDWPVLGDYGFAAKMGPQGFVPGDLGSPMTMAPEMFPPFGDTGRCYPSSDVFSVGMSLARLMTLGQFDQISLYEPRRASKIRGLALLAREAAIRNAPPETEPMALDYDDEEKDYQRFVDALSDIHPELTSMLLNKVLLREVGQRIDAPSFLSAMQQLQPVDGEQERAGLAQLEEGFATMAPSFGRHNGPIFTQLETDSAPLFGAPQ